jgi:dTDP-4-amino-4,6-dideoxygalactose transaminase
VGRIYLSPPDVGETERAALLRAFDSGWITPLGPEVDGFESDLCAFTGAEAAAALSSGTAGLHLALLLAGVQPGDEVWLPSLTFVAPANAATYVGAKLRFLDSERRTWNLDPDLLEAELESAAAIDRLPAAVIVVDLYGQCAQLDRIAEICDRFGVALIEDAAEALGASWQGRSAGTWARYGVYSFNGNKIMTTAGGGMLVGPAEDMERARYLASQARRPVAHYEHDEVGFNYRLSNLLAALGRAQLERLPAMVERCHQINATYRSALADRDGIDFMPWDPAGRTNGWLTVMTLDPEVFGDRVTPDLLCRALGEAEIEARPAWKPMHRQPVFAGVPMVGGGVADHVFDHGVCLPSGSGLTDDDVERVIAAVRAVCRR